MSILCPPITINLQSLSVKEQEIFLQAASPFSHFSYPEWVHGIGYFLILVAAAQFPIWAVLQMLYYLCHPKKRVSPAVQRIHT